MIWTAKHISLHVSDVYRRRVSEGTRQQRRHKRFLCRILFIFRDVCNEETKKIFILKYWKNFLMKYGVEWCITTCIPLLHRHIQHTYTHIYISNIYINKHMHTHIYTHTNICPQKPHTACSKINQVYVSFFFFNVLKLKRKHDRVNLPKTKEGNAVCCCLVYTYGPIIMDTHLQPFSNMIIMILVV